MTGWKTGTGLIAAERRRQVEAEGWTPEHDAEHVGGELARAAAVLVLHASSPLYADRHGPEIWPPEWAFKQGETDIRNLVKAGALIAAEIDRLLSVGRDGAL